MNGLRERRKGKEDPLRKILKNWVGKISTARSTNSTNVIRTQLHACNQARVDYYESERRTVPRLAICYPVTIADLPYNMSILNNFCVSSVNGQLQPSTITTYQCLLIPAWPKASKIPSKASTRTQSILRTSLIHQHPQATELFEYHSEDWIRQRPHYIQWRRVNNLVGGALIVTFIFHDLALG